MSTDPGGVPIFCPICGTDIGPIWPKPPNGPFPAVVHLANGCHEFDWPPDPTGDPS